MHGLDLQQGLLIDQSCAHCSLMQLVLKALVNM